MAKFFIERPVFAMVIAIVTVILGAVAIPNLPIATYPEVVPPVVQITANLRGGNAQDLERTVAQPIEQQLVALDGMLYFFSRSSNDGVLTVDVTFDLGTNIDTAVVQTQNRISLALPALPSEVQREGVTVKKLSTAILLGIAFTSKDDRSDAMFLNNFVTINVLDRIASLPGVGEARLASRQDYGMRVWVNPSKMATLGLTTTDLTAAIQAQNRQNPSGSIGQPPMASGTDLQYPVNAAGRLVEPQQFGDIVLRAELDGSLLRIRDLARVELGAQDYKTFSRFDNKPASVVLVYLTPGANAVETADRVRRFLDDARPGFPAGLDYRVGFDATRFVKTSIADVVVALFEAIALVVLVVFVFLQNWRATLIPLLAVPVSIVGTFALFPLLGFSINMTSMFGLVLAIGIVVDDAIVVVEAVQHKIDLGLSPRDATVQAMDEVSGPVVAIACILAAVVIPFSYLGGISGQIYRQFALTIAASVLLSAFNALTLSPALSALILKPRQNARGWLSRVFGGFNRAFAWTTNRYLFGVKTLVRRGAFALVALAACYVFAGALFRRAPSGFLPDEDQGVFFVAVRLPDGASIERTDRVVGQVEEILRSNPGVEAVTTLGGLDRLTNTINSNVSTVIALLKPWDERDARHLDQQAILRAVQPKFAQLQSAIVFGFGLPPIIGLGASGGFELMLQEGTAGNRVDQHRLANDRAAVSRRSGYRQGTNTRRPGHRCLFGAADLPRRALCERLQPLRPDMAGVDAGRAAISRAARGHQSVPRARPRWRHDPVEHVGGRPRGVWTGGRLSVQPVPGGAAHRHKRAGIQLRAGRGGDRASRARDAAARIRFRVDGHTVSTAAQRRRGTVHFWLRIDPRRAVPSG